MLSTLETTFSKTIAGVIGHHLSFEEYCRRIVFAVCIVLFVLILLTFGVYHVVVDSPMEGIVDLAIACYLISVLAGLKSRNEGETLSYSVGIVTGALLVYLGTQGADHGYRILWVYTYPALMMIIYGRHIALAYVGVVFAAWVFFLLAPTSLTGAAVYEAGQTLRFIASFAVVTFVAWFTETIRAHYQVQMQRRARQLEDEQHRLLAAEAKMRKLAHEDALTGISNRRCVMDDLARAIDTPRAADRFLGVALIDIDHFKRINDTYGHQVGDQVLIALAQRISRIVRRTDHLGRYGGEEFLLVLNDVTEIEALSILELVRTAVEQAPFYVAARPIDVTISAGVALGAPNEESDALILAADTAVYTAKERGRNQVSMAPVPTLENIHLVHSAS